MCNENNKIYVVIQTLLYMCTVLKLYIMFTGNSRLIPHIKTYMKCSDKNHLIILQ
jgi:hypothetical protein